MSANLVLRSRSSSINGTYSVSIPAICCSPREPSTSATAVTVTSAVATSTTRRPMRWRNFSATATLLDLDYLGRAGVGLERQIRHGAAMGQDVRDHRGRRVGLRRRHALAREDLLVPVALELRRRLLQDVLREPLADREPAREIDRPDRLAAVPVAGLAEEGIAQKLAVECGDRVIGISDDLLVVAGRRRRDREREPDRESGTDDVRKSGAWHG